MKAAMHDEEMNLPSVVLAVGFKVSALIFCWRMGRRRKAPDPGDGAG